MSRFSHSWPAMLAIAAAGVVILASPAQAGWWPFGASAKPAGSKDQAKGGHGSALTPVATGSAAATGSVPASGSTQPLLEDNSPKIHVTDIEISGNHDVTQEQILLALPIHAGEDVTRQQVLDALRHIYGMGYFLDVKANTEPTANGDRLIFYVIENPPLKEVKLSGVTVFSPAEILEEFGPMKGQIIDLNQVKKIVTGLEKRYQDKGYILAHVEDLHVDPDGTLQIKVSEGVIQKIEIQGNEETKDYVIRREFTL
ncbi:MAG: hypothetical protein KGR26_04775, partial [Cyanobacteria bacterium REEB65]|nr:hypothetical protein [Cyanobacteria bacterium REEB65]